jgi:hypothetical protein
VNVNPPYVGRTGVYGSLVPSEQRCTVQRMSKLPTSVTALKDVYSVQRVK